MVRRSQPLADPRRPSRNPADVLHRAVHFTRRCPGAARGVEGVAQASRGTRAGVAGGTPGPRSPDGAARAHRGDGKLPAVRAAVDDRPRAQSGHTVRASCPGDQGAGSHQQHDSVDCVARAGGWRDELAGPSQARGSLARAPCRVDGAGYELAERRPRGRAARLGGGIQRPRHSQRRHQAMSGDPARFLNTFAQALAALALYRDGHPARERAIDLAYQQVQDLQRETPHPLFTFLGDEVVFGRLPLRELKAWDWGKRLAQAGIQRLEFEDRVSREDFEGFLEEVLARLTLSAISSEARQMRRSSIRFGAVGLKGETDVPAESLPTATI